MGHFHDSARDQARELILQHGCNANAYQILNPGIQHWFSTRHRAVVGFVLIGRWWIVAGAPVCDPTELVDTALEFQAFVRRRHGRVCYCCAEQRLVDRLTAIGQAAIVLGAQPVWIPAQWPQLLGTHRSLRDQLRRAGKKGVTIRQVSAPEARADSGLQECLTLWLQTRRLPPMGFLVEPRTLELPYADRLIWAADQVGTHGHRGVVAFLVASPVPRRRGFLIEQIVRRPDAPNGTVELLIDACMRELHGRGAAYATQGLVVLSRYASAAMASNPWWIRGLTVLGRRYLGRWYGFQTLESFRARMRPAAWEPVYAISGGRNFSPSALYAMAAAFQGGRMNLHSVTAAWP